MAETADLDLDSANQKILARRQPGTDSRDRARPLSVVPRRLESDSLQEAIERMKSSAQQAKRPTCSKCSGVVSDFAIEKWWKSGANPLKLRCEPCKAAARAEAERKRVDRMPDLMGEAGVSLSHSMASVGDFGEAEQAALTHGLAHTGCVILGLQGRGKTRFAAAAVRQKLTTGESAKLIMSGPLMRQIRRTYADNAGTDEEAILEELCTVGLLAIDDLGREGGVTEHVKRILHEILSRRIDNLLPTFITTNLALEEIADVYDPAIHSRVASLLPVWLDGPDRRLA